MAWDKMIEDRDREQKISDQIPITILLFKMDRRSDHDPQKRIAIRIFRSWIERS